MIASPSDPSQTGKMIRVATTATRRKKRNEKKVSHYHCLTIHRRERVENTGLVALPSVLDRETIPRFSVPSHPTLPLHSICV